MSSPISAKFSDYEEPGGHAATLIGERDRQITVTDADGRLIADAKVIYLRQHNGGDFYERCELQRAPDGRFGLPLELILDSSTVELWVAPSEETGVPQFMHELSSRPGSINLKLPTLHPAQFEILDELGGKLFVYSLIATGQVPATWIADAPEQAWPDGISRLDLPLGEFELSVFAGSAGMVVTNLQFEVPGSTFRVPIQGPILLRGMVTDSAGLPVGGAAVEIANASNAMHHGPLELPATGELGWPRESTTTNSKGLFELRIASVDDYSRIWAWSEHVGFSLAHLPEDITEPVVLELSPGGAVSGSAPSEAKLVHIWRRYAVNTSCGTTGRCFIAIPNSEGWFHVRNIPPGDWFLEFAYSEQVFSHQLAGDNDLHLRIAEGEELSIGSLKSD